MSKVFRNAIIVNVALLVVFVLLDGLTWSNLGDRLGPFISAIRQNATLSNAWWTTYSAIYVSMNVVYFPTTTPPTGVSATAALQIVNLPLIWFVVTITVNLFLIWYQGRRGLISQ